MDKLEQEIWRTQYVQPLFDKYKDVPTDYKYMLIEKDHINMLGKELGKYQVNLMSDTSDSFIYAFDNAVAEFSKTIKNNLFKKYCDKVAVYEYPELLKSGFFWEFFPNLSGNYLQDKEEFHKFVIEREINKGWLNKIL